MSWINRIMLKLIQAYLAVIFILITLVSLVRKMIGKSPMNIRRRKVQESYWVKRDQASLEARTDALILTYPRSRSLWGESAKIFLRERKIDYILILFLLLPVKMFLRIDKSTEVDPSIYVMY